VRQIAARAFGDVLRETKGREEQGVKEAEEDEEEEERSESNRTRSAASEG